MYVPPFKITGMGRYWQTVLLSRWKGIFAWLPVETIVKEHQQEYYNVIARCDAMGESTLFIEFMLGCLLDAMENYEETESEEIELLHDKLHDKFPQLSEKSFEILEVLKVHPNLNAEKIGELVALSQRQVKTYINALKQAGLIVRVGSNKTGYWKVTI
jgi:Fic family protein